MDNFKDCLKPKTFNPASYVAAVGWVVFGVIMLSVFADIETSEPRFDFRCGAKSENTDLVRAKCFEQYEKQYNTLGVPVYAFVIMNFTLVGLACVVYSLTVNSKVDQLLEARDAENGQRPSESRKLFGAYCCQLAVRLTLVTVFIILQTQLFYPSNFPSEFNCDLTPQSSRTTNASAARNTTTYECHNQRAGKKTFWTNTMIVVNGLFAGVILIEMIWILVRAGRDKMFLKDSQFVASHLNCSCIQQGPVNEEIPLEPTELSSPFTESLKKSIIADTEKPTDLKALFYPKPGEGKRIKNLKLDSIYTKLVLIPDRANYDFSGDREEQLKLYPRPSEKFKPLKGPEEIVDPENRTTLMVGRPGIGKTLFCTKFMRDWASDKVFDKTQDTELNYEMAFLIKFRKFKSIKLLSLRELLSRAEYRQRENISDEVWHYILEHPDRVLIFFDGLDEMEDISSIAKDTVNDNYVNSEEQKMPLAAIYSKIVNRKLLREATIVTTTRPTAALTCISRIEFGRTVEILGFDPEQVEEYVENFTKDAAENLSGAGQRIMQHIRTNMNLFSLCYIPVNCFIICSCLLHIILKKGKDLTDADLPKKITAIYNRAMKLFFFRHNEKYKDEDLHWKEIVSDKFPPPEVEEKIFKPLAKVAFDGVKERRLIFGERKVQGLEDSGLLHQLPDDESGEAQFCFLHLTMQEFLAATHLVDTMDDAELTKFVSNNIGEGEWHVVFQFVAGLLGERKHPINAFTDMLPVETEKKYDDGFIYWRTGRDKQTALTIMKCLYEHEDTEQASDNTGVQNKLEKIGFNAVDFRNCRLAPSDCTAVIHVLKSIPQISFINLGDSEIGPLGCVEIRKLFDNGNCQLTKLNLGDNGITDAGVFEFISKVIPNSKLTCLNLGGNQITDNGVLCLSKVIPDSKLTVLELVNNNITDKGVLQLTKVIPNSKLTLLDLMSNQITDDGVSYLSKVVNHSKLTVLSLSYNKITDIGVDYLCDGVLSKANCKLTVLNLFGNDAITDEAQQRIENANPNCKVSLSLFYM